jgi:K+-transporting ATPase ATPase A chain
MDIQSIIQAFVIIVLAILLVRPTSSYLINVYFKKRTRLDTFFEPIEKLLFRAAGVDASENMSAIRYIFNLLFVNAIMFLFVILILLNQAYLPLNPSHAPNMNFDLAFNTATAFTTNTDWQNYVGETDISYLSQMIGTTFLMFTSAATGMSIGVAFIRGFASREERVGYKEIKGIGNFYFDFVRSITRILIPICFVISIFLVLQGVPQTLEAPIKFTTFEGASSILYRGPVASLESIKHIGTNGGGFFTYSSATPFENPTPLTNIVEILSMLLIPMSFVYAFGVMVGNPKEGRVLIGSLVIILTTLLLIGVIAESSNPALVGVNQNIGNLEGKEVRFGTVGSVLFATVTAATATGSVNSMHDSYTSIGGFVPLSLMMLNTVFGGSGVGLINILIYVILAVFISGLMVGRTPQYLGRKIESREVKLTLLAFLIHPLLILAFTSTGILFATSSILNPGFHGFTEMLYAFTSAAANNGSAFAGLNANTPFLNYTLGATMVLGRYITMPLMLLVSDSFLHKKIVPYDVGTFRTDQWVFGLILIGVILILGALTFFPVLVMGPIGEALM